VDSKSHVHNPSPYLKLKGFITDYYVIVSTASSPSILFEKMHLRS
jgi:hypothetical protein